MPAEAETRTAPANGGAGGSGTRNALGEAGPGGDARERRTLAWLFGIQAALFMTHEVDSGRWAEWRLFGMSAPVFVLVHLLAMALILWGFAGVLRGTRVGAWIALLLGLFGPAALAIHGYFIGTGHPEFRSPESLALIAAMFVAGTGLVVAAVRALRSLPARRSV